MATYNVTAQTRRVQFTGNGTAGPFAFSFQVNATSEIKVYVDSTVKTESSHYTVSLNSGTGAGTVSFTSGNHPSSSETITILGSIPLSRTSVYTSGGQLTASSLEDDFDTNMFVHQQTNEEIDRSLRLAEHDVISGADMTLPVKDTRKGTVLGFNATTGNPEAGPNITSVQSLANVTTAINLLGTSAVVEDLGILGTTAIVEDMALLATSSNVSAMALLGVSSVITDMGILGTADIVEDMGILGTSANVTAMGHLGTSANVTAMGKLGNDATVADMAILGTDAVVANMATLATSDIIADLNTLATSDIVTDMNLLATSANVTAMGVLGTSANVTAMGLLGTSAVVTDMGLLGTTAVVEDMGLLATTAVIEDMGLLATSAVIEDMGLLATSAVIEDMGLLATSANITNMATLGASGVVSNIATVAGISSNVTTVASNVSGVNSFAERYRVGSSDPSSSNDAGDLFFNTSDNTFKFFNGSSYVAVNVSGIDNVVEDTTPQLGGNLDVQTNSIVSTSNRNIAITPNGSGKVVLDGLSYPSADGSNGQFLKTDGSGVLSFEANLTFDGTNLDLGDSKKIRLGDSQDLEIFHDGSNSIIKDNGAGSLIMRGSTRVFIQGVNEEIFFEGNENGQVKLYNDNNVKLTTTSSGVTVTGGLTTTTASSIEGGVVFNESSADVDFRVEGDGNTHALFVQASTDKVAIGNSNPNDYGSLASDFVIGTTSGEHGLTIATGTANSGRIQFADNTSSPFRGAIEYSHSSDALHFYTSGSQRMSIQSNGRVNINTGNDTGTGFRFFAPSGQSSKVAEFARSDGTGCHLPIGSTAFTASSDETLKENITEFDKQTSYDDIKNMRAVTFNYKDWTLDGTTYQDDKKRIGFIAQDWVTNYPEIIDKDQNDKLCMKYTETIPVLLSALQKAQEKIEAMEARITTLEGA